MPHDRQWRKRHASLCHVDDPYYFGVYCQKCKRHSRLSLVKLRKHLGDNFPLKNVRERFRCDHCRSRQAVTTFLAPNQKGGNLHRLFEDEPKGD